MDFHGFFRLAAPQYQARGTFIALDIIRPQAYNITMRGVGKIMQTIYHGSKDIIEAPIFGFGKKYNDYGLGFYCTDHIDLAKEWGVDQNRNGYANIYQIDTEPLSVLNLNGKNYCILHWLAILLDNREFDLPSVLAADARKYLKENFSIDYENYDVIIGYRADDSYFSFAQDFMNGTISYRQLNHAMHLGKLGQQFVLKSEKAFQHIEFTGYEIAECTSWFTKKELRDQSARREYFDVERNKRQKGDIYITQIMDEEIKADDPCLR